MLFVEGFILFIMGGIVRVDMRVLEPPLFNILSPSYDQCSNH